MIRKGIIEKIFEAASIQRWNDHIRPVQFTELDKQAHKMILAWVLGKFEETDKGSKVDWISLIEGAFFEFLQRVILTDIKPPVFYKLIEKKEKELNEFVIKKLESDLRDLENGLKERFEKYFNNPSYAAYEKRILKAAHFLASYWEFKIIYNVCPFIYGIEKTKEEIENQIEDHYDLIGVQKLSLGKKSFGFVDMCAQLRFQKRWAQTPRIPETSVLGHMLVVALLTYLCSNKIKACSLRKYNNFFTALFHDLPEVLTRDISAPIKHSVEELDKIILEYEKVQLEDKILPLLPPGWREEMIYFLEDQFDNRIIENGKKRIISSSEEMKEYNNDKFSPVDGEIIKGCDELAAFIETYLSIKFGIKSERLISGHKQLRQKYKDKIIQGINFGQLFDYFEIEAI